MKHFTTGHLTQIFSLKLVWHPALKAPVLLKNVVVCSLTGHGAQVEVLSYDLLELAVHGSGCKTLAQVKSQILTESGAYRLQTEHMSNNEMERSETTF